MSNDAPDNTLYLIDGHAQIFRSYFAIRGGMSSPVTGEPTNATFAFTGMLLKLFEQYRPKYVAMAIDMGGSGGREALYPEYKATREPPPDDFEPQVGRILEITELFGIPVLSDEQAEADDIIATLVDRLAADTDHSGLRVRIVSKDKDLEQLLSDRVDLFDIHTDTTIDVATLREKKGITPDQVADVLALMGDNVDNIPGVAGIGPKTAAKLICEWGTLDNLLANLDQIKGKRRENLDAARDTLPLSRKLVDLQRDVDVPFDLADAEVQAIAGDELTRVFKELGFNRHITDLNRLLDRDKRLDTDRPAVGDGGFAGGLFASTEADTPAADSRYTRAVADDYRAVTTEAALAGLASTLASRDVIAFDTETRGKDPRSGLCGLSFAWQAGSGVYVPTHSCESGSHLDEAAVIAALRPVLEGPTPKKIAHNAKFDLRVLHHCGVEVGGLAYDTMLAGYLLGLPGVGMDAMAMSVLSHETIPITSLIGEKKRGATQKSMADVAVAEITPYAAEDADITYRLYEATRPRLAALGLSTLNEEVETPLARVIAAMETHGIRVDAAVLDEQRERLQERIDDLTMEIRAAADEQGDFNIDSTKQLREVLFKKLKFPVVKRTKTGPSTDIEVLERLSERDDLDDVPEPARKIPELMVEYRQLTKLVGTYLVALKDAIRGDTGRVHCSFNQAATATGRLSSNDPNLQNIPIRTELGREVRKAFIADEGHVLVVADYSQIELRVLAHLSKDPALLDAFREGRDIHTAVAAEVFDTPLDEVTGEQRTRAKVINFGIVYGVTAYGLARRIEGLDNESAATLIADYKARFAGIDAFLAKCVKQASEHGHVETILGRRRIIDQIHDRNPQRRALGERLAINSVVQGSAADLIKVAMVRLHERIERGNLPFRILLQIHDELVIEAPEDAADNAAAIVADVMEHAMELDCPIKVDSGVGRSWFDAK